MAGRLVHFELAVPDVANAQAFFAELFAWQLESQLEGSFFRVPGTPSGGIAGADDDRGVVRIYFDVDDLDAAVERVREAGGEAGAIEQSEGWGRWSHCRDDQGTPFGLYELPHPSG